MGKQNGNEETETGLLIYYKRGKILFAYWYSASLALTLSGLLNLALLKSKSMHSAVRPVVFRHGQNWRAASCGGADLRGATSVSWRPQAPILRCCVRPEAGHQGEPCDCDCGEELCYPKHRRGLSDTCSTTIK